MDRREEIRLATLSEPISHYTDAVRFDDTVYVSGVPPFDGQGEVVGPDDVVLQARQVFDNLGAILECVGASFADVLRITVYLTDVADRVAINPVRKDYFGEVRPASTLIGVAALAHPDMKVEIEAVVGLSDPVGRSRE